MSALMTRALQRRTLPCFSSPKWRRQPNAGTHLLLEAGATQERTLEVVRCSAWFGENVHMDIGSAFSCGLGAT
jgi:hypothetical protein